MSSDKTPKQRANARYQKKCITKRVQLNPERDREIIDFLERLPNFAEWVRQKAKEEMRK